MAEHPTHLDLVTTVKQALLATGTDLTGPCGAFQITRRVAWALRDEGAGLIAKFAPHNLCPHGAFPPREDGYGVDVIMYPDGAIYDILVNAETENTPAWNRRPDVDPLLWRPPFNPGDTLPDTPATNVGAIVLELMTIRGVLVMATQRVEALIALGQAYLEQHP